jgi:hypothetical protein
VCVKKTNIHSDHYLADREGRRYNSYRRVYLLHQLADRAGLIDTSPYTLCTPKVYGRVKDFVAMEYVEDRYNVSNLSVDELTDATVSIARQIFNENINFLIKVHDSSKPRTPLKEFTPQSFHTICPGIKNGKVILYGIYDSL